jgi:hypothetical protein
MRAREFAAGVLTMAVMALPSPAGAQHLFYTDTQFPAPAMRRVDDGGTVGEHPVPPGSLPEGLAFDPLNHQVYWVESAWTGARVLRTAPGLGPPVTLIEGLSCLRGIALEPVNGWMFWTSSNQLSGPRIERANLDGSGRLTLFELPVGFNPRGAAVDAVGGHLYWNEFELDAIARCRFDGSDAEFIAFLPAGTRPWGIAVDEILRTLYIAEYGTGVISCLPIPPAPGTALSAGSLPRARAAGGALPLIAGLSDPTYLSLDAAAGVLAWTEAGAGAQRVALGLTTGGSALPLDQPLSAYGGIAFSGVSLLAAPAPGPPSSSRTVELAPVWPNPAAQAAVVTFDLPAAAEVRLDIVDVQGRRVARLAEGPHPAGRHRATWRPGGGEAPASPGIYLACLETGGGIWTRRFATVR